jgi:hypothetical protein
MLEMLALERWRLVSFKLAQNKTDKHMNDKIETLKVELRFNYLDFAFDFRLEGLDFLGVIVMLEDVGSWTLKVGSLQTRTKSN